MLPLYDPAEHLSAIVGMLNVVREWRLARTRDAVNSFDETSADRMMSAIYGDVAYSNAAVGALAPMFEAVFCYEASELRPIFEGHPPVNDYHRWKMDLIDFWNPKAQSDGGKLKVKHDSTVDNIQHGTIQLLTALDLLKCFPPSFPEVTEALFYYRNRSLHNGYEWPEVQRTKFNQYVAKRGWENNKWFAQATIDNKPWIICMTDEFIQECFEMLKQTVKTFEDIRTKLEHGDIHSALRTFWQNDYLKHKLNQ